MGLQQGDPLSPYLPMLAMEVLSQLLEKAKKGGLRQGDPLTLYLLVLAMEVWNQLLERAREGGYLSSFTVKGKGGEVKARDDSKRFSIGRFKYSSLKGKHGKDEGGWHSPKVKDR
ncbi:hypothetical protein CK203_013187 [Vitis vinifera]|uniref:Reverse transcriptase domain-containing protein n=1 Tax=Vitis vinifera TaxID=29760 RepID=A0A438JQ68_VITVI|nr:hypothetical protein CK203_013187 [Vitis vinifera]